MGRVWVPPKVAKELREESQRYAADITNACYRDATCETWDRELRRLDPYLRMVRAPEQFVVGTPLLPGCYHIVRDNPGAPQSVTPIATSDGGFMEPPGRLLEELKSMDLQDTRVERMRERIKDAAERREEKRRETDREERRDELLQRWLAASRTQVSLNRDSPWTQNASGRKPKRG